MAVIAPIIVVCGFFSGFLLAFLNGPTEVCHAIALSEVVSPDGAFFVATPLFLVGSLLLGANVAQTVTTGVISLPEGQLKSLAVVDLLLLGYLSVLIAALIIVIALNLLQVPVSPCHFVVPATIGFSLLVQSPSEIDTTVCLKVFLTWLLTPVISGVVSGITYSLLKQTVLTKSWTDTKRYANIKIVVPLLCAIASAFAAFSITYTDDATVFWFHLFPWWMVVAISLGSGLVTWVTLSALITRQQRRPSALVLKSRGIPEVTDTTPEVTEEPQPITRTNRLYSLSSLSSKFLMKPIKKPLKVKQPRPTVRYSVVTRDESVSMTDSNSNTEDLVSNANDNVIVPFVDHPLCIEYFLVPQGFTEDEVLEHLNEIYYSDYPRLITPRSSLLDPPELFRVTFTPAETNKPTALWKTKYKELPPVNEANETDVVFDSSEDEPESSPLTNHHHQHDSFTTINQYEENNRLRELASTTTETELPAMEKPFSYALFLIACISLVAKSGNEVNNGMGPVIAMYSLYKRRCACVEPIWWIFMIGAVGIVAGLWIVGRRREHQRNQRDYIDAKVASPISNFCIHYGATLTVLAVSHAGMPVSMLHCELFSIAFVSLCRSYDNVNWRTLTKIAVSWLPAMVMSALLSAGLTALLRVMFSIKAVIPVTAKSNTTTIVSKMLNIS